MICFRIRGLGNDSSTLCIDSAVLCILKANYPPYVMNLLSTVQRLIRKYVLNYLRRQNFVINSIVFPLLLLSDFHTLIHNTFRTHLR